MSVPQVAAGAGPGVLLLRHAVAVPRSAWSGDGELRPLDGHGRAQAHARAWHLAANDLAPVHLVSGPASTRPWNRW